MFCFLCLKIFEKPNVDEIVLVDEYVYKISSKYLERLNFVIWNVRIGVIFRDHYEKLALNVPSNTNPKFAGKLLGLIGVL